MVNQSYKKLDDFIIDFSGKIFFLSEIENDKKKIYSKDHYNLFNHLLNNLLKRNKFGLDQNLWTELYYHSIHFYPNIKKIGNIPIKIVTKHNFILPFYMDHRIDKLNTTILHFDSHPDTNYIKDSSQLPDIYKKYIKNHSQKYIEKAMDISWDIGASISGLIMTTGIQNYVWVIPDWIYDKEVEMNYFMKRNKKSIGFYTNNKKFDGVVEEVTYIKNENKTEPEAIYAILKSKKKSTLNKIINIINSTGKDKKYILDIDLDYFVCNGEKLNIERYMKDPYDVASFYRTKSIVVNEDAPRDAAENTLMLKRYENQLHTELKHINKRIRSFLHLISSLKKRGYTPSYIDISDSTNVQFLNCKSCNSRSNGFLPVHLALYVNTHILDGLERIF